MTLTAHTLTMLGIQYPHRPFCLHQSFTHHNKRPPTVRFCSPADGRYVCLSWQQVTLCVSRVQTDAALNSLHRLRTQTTLTLGWRQEHAHWSDASHLPVTERILAKASAYYTCELLFSASTAMRSHPVYYT